MPTRAIVLAAGQGKRMRSKRSKLLHDLLGQPILGRVLKALDALLLEHIHVVVGHEADQVREYLASYKGTTPISWHVQEPQQGTGHAVMQVQSSLSNFNGELLVLPGDSPLLTSRTLRELINKHSSEKADVSIVTVALEDAKNYGRVIRSSGGDVMAIVEDKDATPEQKQIKEINSAVYCFSWPLVQQGLDGLSNDNKQKEYYLTDLLAWAHREKLKISDLPGADWREFAGINSRVELAEASRLLRDKVVERLSLEDGVTIIDAQSTWVSPEVEIGQDSVIMPGCSLIGTIKIADSCTIGPHTSIEGTVHIGSHSNIIHSHLVDCQVGSECSVGPFAHIRPGSVLSDHVRAGNFVEIKKSFVGLNTNVSHLSYIGDATIGKGSNIGAGTIVANYDHITKAKECTIIGDGVAVGSNTVLVAPLSIGNDSVIAGGTVVTRNVPSGALAVGRARQENVEGWSDKRRRLAGNIKLEGNSPIETKAVANSSSSFELKTEPKQEIRQELKLEPYFKSQAESVLKSKGKLKEKAELKSKIKLKAKPKSKSEPKPKVKPKAKGKPKPKPKAKGKSKKK